MTALGWPAWATLAAVVVMLVLLVREAARPETVLVGTVAVLVALGILTPQEGFAGFASGAVVAVGSLFVVAAAVQDSGALGVLDRLLFPPAARPREAAVRIGLVVGALSSVLNNTPLVALLVPRAQAWCARTGVAPSAVMIPLSYAAILGGVTTLVGTSTNLVVSGLMEEAGAGRLGLFTQTPVALPAALAGLAALVLVSTRLLPRGAAAPGANTIAMRVPAGSPLAGRTVEEAGLRALGTAFLLHVRRGADALPATPETALRAGDVLTFQGEALDPPPGLVPDPSGPDGGTPGTAPDPALPIFEAVVAPGSALVGQTLRGVAFRERFGGAVVAIQRADAAVPGGLGRTPLAAGDLLLVEAPAGWDVRWKARRDLFLLVAPRRAESVPPTRAPVALAVLLAVVGVAAAGVAPIETTAFIGAALLVATGTLSAARARRAIDGPTLVVIAMALGVGHAIEATGLAAALAGAAVGSVGAWGPFAVLAAVYVVTAALTEVVTNTAAAAIMVAVALGASSATGVPPAAFGVAVALAASASFLTPIGYQTNLMVMSAGGYRVADYARAGLPVSLAFGSVALLMIHLLWF